MRGSVGLKYYFLILASISAPLISVACSDDENDIFNGGGTSGSSGSDAGMGGEQSGGGSGGKESGGGTAGTGTAGTGGSSGGSAGMMNGGTAGTLATAGSAGEGGASLAGAAGTGAGEGGALMDGGAGGGDGEGGAVTIVADVLDNPGFEEGSGVTIPGWTLEGNSGAAFIEASGPNSGSQRLTTWTKWENDQSPAYTARVFQTVSPIPNGTYSFSMYVDRDWYDTQYLFARGFNADDAAQEVTQVTDDAKDPAGYVKITLSNIVVTSGSVTVGIYSAAPAGTWAGIDDAQLVLAE